MIRSECYLKGRLVKQFEQVEISTVEGLATGGRGPQYVDGRHIWLMDGAEIAEDVARLLLRHGAELEPAPSGR